MFILNVTKKTKLFSSVQIEAINIYTLIHSMSKEDCAKSALHEFNIDLNGLRIVENLLHDFAEVDDLDIDLIIGVLNSLIDEYEKNRNCDLNDEGEYSKHIQITDHLIYLSLLEFSDYMHEVCDEDHLRVINRLYTLIEPV